MSNSNVDINTDLKVIGVGGGGSRAISYMLSNKIEGASFIVMNTDVEALNAHPCLQKVLLKNSNQVKGPLLGRQSVIESKEDIEKALLGSQLLILVAGMGGNTATSALPFIVQIAKQMGIFVACMVNVPFEWEGKKRMESAKEGIKSLEQLADSVVVFHNENLPNDLTISNSFDVLNNALFQGARYISGLLGSITGEIDEKAFEYLRNCIKNHDFTSDISI